VRYRRHLGRPVRAQPPLEVQPGLAHEQLVDPRRRRLVHPGAAHVQERAGRHEPPRVGQALARPGADVRRHRRPDPGCPRLGGAVGERELLGPLAAGHREAAARCRRAQLQVVQQAGDVTQLGVDLRSFDHRQRQREQVGPVGVGEQLRRRGIRLAVSRDSVGRVAGFGWPCRGIRLAVSRDCAGRVAHDARLPADVRAAQRLWCRVAGFGMPCRWVSVQNPATRPPESSDSAGRI
jgi:hypothetical protein